MPQLAQNWDDAARYIAAPNDRMYTEQAKSQNIKGYRKVSNIICTPYQNLNDCRLILQLSVPNPLKPSVKSIMKM